MVALVLPAVWLFGFIAPVALFYTHGSLIAGLVVAALFAPIVLGMSAHVIWAEYNTIRQGGRYVARYISR